MIKKFEVLNIEILKQVSQWMRTGRFFSYQNENNYLTALKGVQTPTLLMGGFSEALRNFVQLMQHYLANTTLYEGDWDLFPLLEEKSSHIVEKIQDWAQPYRDNCWT